MGLGGFHRGPQSGARLEPELGDSSWSDVGEDRWGAVEAYADAVGVLFDAADGDRPDVALAARRARDAG